MKFLAFVFVAVLLAVVFFALISLFRVAYVHIKAFMIRRRLSRLVEPENKKDD